jgi:hypothetical protein
MSRPYFTPIHATLSLPAFILLVAVTCLGTTATTLRIIHREERFQSIAGFIGRDTR